MCMKITNTVTKIVSNTICHILSVSPSSIYILPLVQLVYVTKI